MVLFDVTRDFDKACEKLIGENYHLLKFVKTHERRNLVLSNLCEQILVYERSFAKLNYGVTGKAGPNSAERTEMIEAIAGFFILAVVEQRKQACLSSAAKSQIINKDNLKNEMSKILREVP